MTGQAYRWFLAGAVAAAMLPSSCWSDDCGEPMIDQRSMTIRYETLDGTTWEVEFRQFDESYCDPYY